MWRTIISLKALLLNTLSKLTSSDSKRFSVLIDDIFSTVNKEMTTVCQYNIYLFGLAILFTRICTTAFTQ